MKRLAAIASLAAILALSGCDNKADEETPDAPLREGKAAPEAPRTDADGNEIVSEGPSDDATPYTVASGTARTPAPAPRTTRRDSAPAKSAPKIAKPSPKPAPATEPTQGSKLQKADPQ